MRIQILSDLHVDAGGIHRPEPVADADVLIVAGDVCAGMSTGFEELRHYVPAAIPVVMVAGNHEFYGLGLAQELAKAQATARGHNIHFLENDTINIDGVRFVGATLWTDYALFGSNARDACMQAAQSGLNDHRLIGLTTHGPHDRQFKPLDALAMHQQSRAYLDATLALPHDGPTVVVTHHAPHEKSVHPKFRAGSLTAAFVSDLAPLIDARQPALWVHGHTHSSFDYRVGATRVICNPAGYGHENLSFDPALVVTL
jgi:Icc-related predicted phosphoesterase